MIRRIKETHFPAVKTLEEFQFQSAEHIPVALVKKSSGGEYLERNVPQEENCLSSRVREHF